MNETLAVAAAILGVFGITVPWLYKKCKRARLKAQAQQIREGAASLIAAESRIQQEGLMTRLLQRYYPDPELREQNLCRYSFAVNGKQITTNIASKASWFGLRLPISDTERDRFQLVKKVVSLPSIPEGEQQRILNTITKKGVRFDDKPMFALHSFAPCTNDVVASFSLVEYKDYKLALGLLEEELVQALVDADLDPDLAYERREYLLPGRNTFLKDCKTIAEYSNRLCVGGTNVLLAFRRPEEDDFAFFLKRRSRKVSTGRGVFSLLPSGTHQPELVANAQDEAPIAATVYRETLEELFGGKEIEVSDGHQAARRYRFADQLRWFQEPSNRSKFVLELVSFGLNLFDGTFEFGVLLAVKDERYWKHYEKTIKISDEFADEDTPPFSTKKRDALADIICDPRCADTSLIALVEGLRRLKQIEPTRVNLPDIEVVRA